MTPPQEKLCVAVADAVDANDGKPVRLTARWWAEVGSQNRTVCACIAAGYLLREQTAGELRWFLSKDAYAKIKREAP